MILGLCLCLPATASQQISFSLSQPGQVSLAIYDSRQHLLRELLRGSKLDPGDHRISWDALDRYGQPAPAGDYEWRLLRTPGFSREFLVNLGTNPGWSPFDLWPGNHAGPTSLFVDSETNLYIGSVSSEGPPHLLKMSANGRHKFWDTGTWGLRDGLTGITRVGDLLYLLFGNGNVDILNAETGVRFSAAAKRRGDPVSTYPFFSVLHPADFLSRTNSRSLANISPMAFAGGKDFLVVTYQNHDEVRIYRLAEGLILQTNIISVPQPKAACVSPAGRIFVISSNSLVLISNAITLNPQLITLNSFESPTRLGYDSANDDLLIVQHAEAPVGPLPPVGVSNLDHIIRCHAADGKIIATYGRPTGRSYGHFNPLDFDGLMDIADDNCGGFFTVESFPRRVAHFSSSSPPKLNLTPPPTPNLHPTRHYLLSQWFGGTQWGTLCALDPADPSIAYLFLDDIHCGRARVDYTNRSWTLTHLYAVPDGFQRLGTTTRARSIFPSFGTLSYWEVRHVAGRTFLVNNGRSQGGRAAVVRIDEQENRLVPVALLGGLHATLDKTEPPAWWLAAMKRSGYNTKSPGFDHFAFSWSDQNRNGKIDTDEIMLSSGTGPSSESHCFIDPNWNVFIPLTHRASATLNRHLSPLPAWLTIPNEGSLDAPSWNWNHAKTAKASYPSSEQSFGASSPSGISHDSQGNTYTVCNAPVDWNSADVPPSSWPNNLTGASRFHKWNSAGDLEWSVGLHTSSKDRRPGQFAHVRGILGEVRDCLVVLDACEPASVWTRDGLYAGSLYAPRIRDGLPDLAYNQIYSDDNHWGQVLEVSNLNSQLPTLNLLWSGMSWNSTPVYRIQGWDDWERQSAKLAVLQPAPAAKRRGSGLHADYFANSDLSAQPVLQELDPDIWFGPMWGDHREVPSRTPWPGSPLLITAAPTRRAEVGRSRVSDSRASHTNANQSSTFGSAHWTGFFEPPLSEEYTFSIYTYGISHGGKTTGSKVRLWVNEQLIIDEWDNINFQKVTGWWRTRACESKPISLTAAQPIPIRLECADAGGPEAHLHLFFRSNSLDERHVPSDLLYPSRLNTEH